MTRSRANLFRYPPGAVGRRHIDPIQEEVFVVLDGTLTVHLGEGDEPERHELARGSVLVVQPGTARSSSRTATTTSCACSSSAPRRNAARRRSWSESTRERASRSEPGSPRRNAYRLREQHHERRDRDPGHPGEHAEEGHRPERRDPGDDAEPAEPGRQAPRIAASERGQPSGPRRRRRSEHEPADVVVGRGTPAPAASAAAESPGMSTSGAIQIVQQSEKQQRERRCPPIRTSVDSVRVAMPCSRACRPGDERAAESDGGDPEEGDRDVPASRATVAYATTSSRRSRPCRRWPG